MGHMFQRMRPQYMLLDGMLDMLGTLHRVGAQGRKRHDSKQG